MSGNVVPFASPSRRSASDSAETITVVCARPACRREFPRSLTRGRRQDYCTPKCQQLANSERRKARAKLKHCEESAARLRADCAAYDAGQASTQDAEQRLRLALAKTEGILEYADLDNKVIKQLRDLYVAATAHLECGR